MDTTHALEARLEAVERVLTDEDRPVAAVDDAAHLTARVERVETRLDALEARLDETDAALAAVRGYVGEIRHVNREVERTASAAVAAVDRLDAGTGTPPPIARVDGSESAVPDPASDDSPSTDSPDQSLRDRLGALL